MSFGERTEMVKQATEALKNVSNNNMMPDMPPAVQMNNNNTRVVMMNNERNKEHAASLMNIDKTKKPFLEETRRKGFVKETAMAKKELLRVLFNNLNPLKNIINANRGTIEDSSAILDYIEGVKEALAEMNISEDLVNEVMTQSINWAPHVPSITKIANVVELPKLLVEIVEQAWGDFDQEEVNKFEGLFVIKYFAIDSESSFIKFSPSKIFTE